MSWKSGLPSGWACFFADDCNARPQVCTTDCMPVDACVDCSEAALQLPSMRYCEMGSTPANYLNAVDCGSPEAMRTCILKAHVAPAFDPQPENAVAADAGTKTSFRQSCDDDGQTGGGSGTGGGGTGCDPDSYNPGYVCPPWGEDAEDQYQVTWMIDDETVCHTSHAFPSQVLSYLAAAANIHAGQDTDLLTGTACASASGSGSWVFGSGCVANYEPPGAGVDAVFCLVIDYAETVTSDDLTFEAEFNGDDGVDHVTHSCTWADSNPITSGDSGSCAATDMGSALWSPHYAPHTYPANAADCHAGFVGVQGSRAPFPRRRARDPQRPFRRRPRYAT